MIWPGCSTVCPTSLPSAAESSVHESDWYVTVTSSLIAAETWSTTFCAVSSEMLRVTVCMGTSQYGAPVLNAAREMLVTNGVSSTR